MNVPSVVTAALSLSGGCHRALLSLELCAFAGSSRSPARTKPTALCKPPQPRLRSLREERAALCCAVFVSRASSRLYCNAFE